ncbi:ABC transporter ATP-binding protein [Candidatus Haliotispira prima]|uniref:ABC transporter ATP-binding protein n=1 Tax=Candidatus Haliotispira prima TaxID=3034016 RepID=A0ABY8MLF6_9SPIO|nr:ABC transporter ATP-binding protein [Candidatus Haliotispira prima]
MEQQGQIKTEDRNTAIVECRDVVKHYYPGSTKVEALRGLNVSFYPGFNLILGPSGSGKSTALNLIGCLDTATFGEVFVNGQDVGLLSEAERCEFRRQNVGFIFQSFSLISSLDLMDNIEYPLYKNKAVSAAERRERAENLLKEVGLEGYNKRFPRELSGGQQQRVAIARSLVANPKLLIADEPTASLDSETSAKILELLERIHDEFGTSIILASHDRNVIEHINRKVVLRDGVIATDKSA